MRLSQLLGPAVLVAGLLTLALAVSRGEASLSLILIVPVVIGTGPLAALGILLVFAGFFLTFFLGFTASPPLMPPGPTYPVARPTLESARELPEVPPEPSRHRRWGGVVFLGPIPLVFGSDPKMTRVMLILGLVLFVGLLGLTLVLLLS